MKWWKPAVYVFLPMVLWSIMALVVLTFFRGNEITISQASLLALFTIVYLFGYVFLWRMYCDDRDTQERKEFQDKINKRNTNDTQKMK